MSVQLRGHFLPLHGASGSSAVTPAQIIEHCSHAGGIDAFRRAAFCPLLLTRLQLRPPEPDLVRVALAAQRAVRIYEDPLLLAKVDELIACVIRMHLASWVR